MERDAPTEIESDPGQQGPGVETIGEAMSGWESTSRLALGPAALAMSNIGEAMSGWESTSRLALGPAALAMSNIGEAMSGWESTSRLALGPAALAMSNIGEAMSGWESTSRLALGPTALAMSNIAETMSEWDSNRLRTLSGAGAAALSMRSAIANVRTPVPGFRDAARGLLEDVGFGINTVDDEMAFEPSDDDRAYEAIHKAAPELADAVDTAAARVQTPFWSRRAVRNALAWMLVSFVVAAYVLDAVLPGPLGAVLTTLLGLSGASVVGAYKLAAPAKGQGDEAKGRSQDLDQ